jgi:hypothetical protein
LHRAFTRILPRESLPAPLNTLSLVPGNFRPKYAETFFLGRAISLSSGLRLPLDADRASPITMPVTPTKVIAERLNVRAEDPCGKLPRTVATLLVLTTYPVSLICRPSAFQARRRQLL